MHRLKVRYVAGGLVLLLLVCVVAIVLLRFKDFNLGVSLKYEDLDPHAIREQQESIRITLVYLKWATMVAALMLMLLVGYRWFIRPSVHQH
jgi:hypothetical protein